MSLSGLLAIGPAYRWDDLRGPASSIPIRGQSGDPDATADTYAADAVLYEADLHYLIGGLGSEEEYPT